MIDSQETPAPIPPPLPNRNPIPAAEPVEAKPVMEKPKVPEESAPVPSPFEMADNTMEEVPIEVEEETEVPAVIHSPMIGHEVTDFACDILDLFTLNSSHYKISTAFAKYFLNEALSSKIVPHRVEKYFLDRTFGRGPGIILRGEICLLEEGKPVTLVIAYPEDANLDDLRAAVGKSHAFSGSLLRCDTFSREIFLVADVAET